MPVWNTFSRVDRSKEWRHWENHYLDKGCGQRKAEDLAFKKMRRLGFV